MGTFLHKILDPIDPSPIPGSMPCSVNIYHYCNLRGLLLFSCVAFVFQWSVVTFEYNQWFRSRLSPSRHFIQSNYVCVMKSAASESGYFPIVMS